MRHHPFGFESGGVFLFQLPNGDAMSSRARKRCPSCCPPGVELPASSFPPCRSRPDGLQTYCRNCYRVRQREYHARDGNGRRAAVRENTRRARARNRELIIEYLSRSACADCGIADPIVLEFHHVGGKTLSVCLLVGRGYGRGRIEEELQRCLVLCANCHRIRTAKERGYYRAIGPSGKKIGERIGTFSCRLEARPTVALHRLAG
jgi:hypothetical protein